MDRANPKKPIKKLSARIYEISFIYLCIERSLKRRSENLPTDKMNGTKSTVATGRVAKPCHGEAGATRRRLKCTVRVIRKKSTIQNSKDDIFSVKKPL